MNRRLLLLALLVLGACATKTREPAFDYGEPANKYSLRGTVLRLRPADRIAVIRHDKIEGWMEPMTMEFPVPDPAQFAKLRENETIRATVLTNDLHYWLTDITQDSR